MLNIIKCGSFIIESISHIESICNRFLMEEGEKMYPKLSELMEQRGETAYQVSKATGISQTAFSNWKAGITRPSAKSLATLAKYFNVSMEYFMEEVRERE